MIGTNSSTNYNFVQVKTKTIKVCSSRHSSKVVISDSVVKRQCKICLTEQKSQDKFISPCKCSGSLQYVHEECFRLFLRKKYEHAGQKLQEKLKEGIHCEICHEKYDCSVQRRYKCGSLQYVKNQIQKRKMTFALLLVLFTIVLVGFILGLMYTFVTKRNSKYRVDPEEQLLINIGLGIVSAFLLIGIVILIKYFILLKNIQFIIKDNFQNEIQISLIPITITPKPSNTEESHLRMQNV